MAYDDESSASGSAAITARGLRKRYGSTWALDGLDMDVPDGVVYGVLGPNGAGKTTFVRVSATLVRADEGRVEVAGYDARREPVRLRQRIGLVGQYAAVDEVLSGRQNLELFGRLYHLDRRTARRRADELLDRFDLAATGRTPVKTYSGGMRRRLDLAAGMILAPRVLFLDEPTTGLDPRGRGEVWDAIRGLVDGGTTVLLTTQYLDEADQLAARISVLDRGTVIAEGTPAELKSLIGGDRVEIVCRETVQVPLAADLLGRVGSEAVHREPLERRLSVAVSDRVAALTHVVRELDAAGLDVEDVGLRRPTLDEVFLHLTGHRTSGPDEQGEQGVDEEELVR